MSLSHCCIISLPFTNHLSWPHGIVSNKCTQKNLAGRSRSSRYFLLTAMNSDILLFCCTVLWKQVYSGTASFYMCDSSELQHFFNCLKRVHVKIVSCLIQRIHRCFFCFFFQGNFQEKKSATIKKGKKGTPLISNVVHACNC